MNKKYSRKDFIELLKTGDFTMIYWDSDEVEFYKGKLDYNKEYIKDEYKTMDKSKIKLGFDIWGEGYATEIAILLVEALGGNIDSI